MNGLDLQRCKEEQEEALAVLKLLQSIPVEYLMRLPELFNDMDSVKESFEKWEKAAILLTRVSDALGKEKITSNDEIAAFVGGLVESNKMLKKFKRVLNYLPWVLLIIASTGADPDNALVKSIVSLIK